MPFSHHAQALQTAYRERLPVVATPDSGPANTAEAYATQRALWQALAGNVRPTAWKVTATAMGETPMAAPILPQRLFIGSSTTPAPFPSQTLINPGIEAELAVRFGQDLPPRPTPYRLEEIRAAIAGLCVTMEIVDTRLADPQAAGPNWRLADSLLNGGLIIGTPIPDWRDLHFDALPVRVHAGKEVLADRLGTQPLGDLFHCLPWLIGHAGGFRAGDMVTTGAWTGMHPLAGWGSLPLSCVVTFDDLGSAAVTFA